MSGTLKLNDTVFATENNGAITTDASTIKVGGTTVIDSNRAMDVSEVKVGGNTVIDSNRKMTGVDVVPTSSMMFRNKIINGNFDIWQRGDSFTSTSVNEWSADRFRTEGYGLSTTISKQVFTANQTDVPYYPTYYCRVATSAAPSSDQYWAFQQRIEAPQNISYGTYTLSFWIRCTSGSLSAGAFRYGVGGNSQTSPALSTTWTKLTHTHTISSFNASDYVTIYLIYLTSTSPSSLSVDIAQVQVEEGSVVTPFEHRPYGLELSLCQRYYAFFRAGGGMYWSNGNVVATASYPVEMRDTPQSVTVKSVITDYPASSTWTAARITKQGFEITRSGGTSYLYVVADWTANAEL